MAKGSKATVTDVTKRISLKPNKTEGIINYDVDNAYPQRVIDIINSSGTATLCTEILSKFIYGGGFASESLAKLKLNKQGVTANKLLFKVCQTRAKLKGLALHVNYNALYKVSSISFVPFQDVRFTDDDEKNEHRNMLAVYDDWQKVKRSKIYQKDIDYIHFYNPKPDVIQRQVEEVGGWQNYKGQILYYTPEGIKYPLAPSDAVLEDVQTDAHAKTFKNRNITTNFMASYIVRTGMFEGEQEREEFIESLTNFQGQDNALKMMLMEEEDFGADAESASFKLEKVDIQDIEKLYEYTEESVRNNIIRNYLIPPTLLVATAGKLGTSTEIQDATAFYNGVTEDLRSTTSEIFQELLSNSVFQVEDDFDIKPVKASTVDAKDTPEGKAKIVDVLKDTTLSPQSKQNILIDLYGFTIEEAIRLVPTSTEII